MVLQERYQNKGAGAQEGNELAEANLNDEEDKKEKQASLQKNMLGQPEGRNFFFLKTQRL